MRTEKLPDRILIIDNDSTLLELLCAHLHDAGYEPLPAPDGPSGLRCADEAPPDLVILDVMLAGMDGWQVCEQLREKSSVPIIMLTAKGEELDQLLGFKLGVDDYVAKPFSLAELTARVGAVLARRRRTPQTEHQVSSGDLMIDFERRRVTVKGRGVELTPTQYRLLEVLARRANRPVPHDALLATVWGPEYAGEVQLVKRSIWSLRKKIEADPGDPRHILTERGYGYRFE